MVGYTNSRLLWSSSSSGLPGACSRYSSLLFNKGSIQSRLQSVSTGVESGVPLNVPDPAVVVGIGFMIADQSCTNA